MRNKLDDVLNQIQLYSYLLPTVRIGNAIMDFREKYTLCKKRDEVKEMKNKEKFAKEVVEIACYGDYFGMDKRTGEIASCDYIPCRNCMFNDGMNCNKTRKDWAEQEYIEKPVISKKDRAFLDYLEEEYKHIARDKNDALYAYNAEPCKVRESWSSGCSDDWFRLNHRFDVNFPMVKWSDSEPWLIEDLKKLEVVENYE